jgi:hypothetical protein
MSAGSDALAEAARLETARVYGSTCPEPPRRADAEAEAAVFGRPADTYYGPAPAPALVQLVEAISPRTDARRRDRRRIEQAIARGGDDAAIGGELHVPAEDIAFVRSAMDRAAS